MNDDLQHCTCGPARNEDGSENGLCTFCENELHDERFGNRDMLNELHSKPQEPTP